MRSKKILARNIIKSGLYNLPISCTKRFKAMYSARDLEKDINTVIDDVPDNKLSWAVKQVQNSLDNEFLF